MFLTSRRTFLKKSFLTSAVLVMSGGKLFGAVSPLQTIELVQQDLFPSTSNVPTTNDINAYAYLVTILHHSRVSDSHKAFIRNGVQWLNEESIKMYKKTYMQLLSQERQNVLKNIAKYRWGENWIDTILTYIFEAMLGDPIYGGNKNQAGWKWLHHKGGNPRPTKALV